MPLKIRSNLVCLTIALIITAACSPEYVHYGRTKQRNGTLCGYVHGYYMDNRSSFKIQLIEGDRVNHDMPKDYVYPEAQVFVTEKDGEFRFDSLTKETYTLIASKRFYRTIKERVRIREDVPTWKGLTMSQDTLSSESDCLEVLSEDAEIISRIDICRGGTLSVCFYLHNNATRTVWYDINYIPYGHTILPFIIDGEIRHIGTTWIKEINPASGVLASNEICLVEVGIDPNVYLLNEHAECHLLINQKTITLNF